MYAGHPDQHLYLTINFLISLPHFRFFQTLQFNLLQCLIDIARFNRVKQNSLFHLQFLSVGFYTVLPLLNAKHCGRILLVKMFKVEIDSVADERRKNEKKCYVQMKIEVGESQ